MEISETNNETIVEAINKDLFGNVMKGDWEAVVQIYERDSRACKVKITKAGHTALHVAVSDAEEEIAKKLVEMIKGKYPAEAKKVLEMKNSRGHTPLHQAAAAGKYSVCESIVTVDKSLALVRDSRGETPIFRAVHYGRDRTFLYLHSVLLDATDDEGERYSCCKRYDGQTILHDAVIREYFGEFLDFHCLYIYIYIHITYID